MMTICDWERYENTDKLSICEIQHKYCGKYKPHTNENGKVLNLLCWRYREDSEHCNGVDE